MIVDPTRVCELLVGLGDVTVLGAVDEPDGPVIVHVETRADRPSCPGCGGSVWAKDQRPVELVDLPAFGRPARLVWHKRRWSCPDSACALGSFTEAVGRIAAARLVMTDEKNAQRAAFLALERAALKQPLALETLQRLARE